MPRETLFLFLWTNCLLKSKKCFILFDSVVFNWCHTVVLACSKRTRNVWFLTRLVARTKAIKLIINGLVLVSLDRKRSMTLVKRLMVYNYVHRAKTEEVIAFLTMLQERVEKLHMWVASYRSDISPPGWRGKILTESISCPPSVVRETEQCSPGISKYSTNKYLLPSDGLPVITVRHRGPGHVERDPRDCEVCGEETARILIQDLRVGNKGIIIFRFFDLIATENFSLSELCLKCHRFNNPIN